MKLKYSEAVSRYGAIEKDKWDRSLEWCVSLVPPKELKWINTATGKPVTKIYCNKDMAPALELALKNVVDRGLADELHSFDGCFCIRRVRGDEKLSTHAYALAIDANAKTNELGTDGDMSPELAKCFTDAGFAHGRTFARKDPMHFSYAWE